MKLLSEIYQAKCVSNGASHKANPIVYPLQYNHNAFANALQGKMLCFSVGYKAVRACPDLQNHGKALTHLSKLPYAVAS